MAIAKYDHPRATTTEAHGTGFRFGEWHVIGVSYDEPVEVETTVHLTFSLGPR